eukprot:scaffold161338_cov38-Attheya_sp.AAC.1
MNEDATQVEGTNVVFVLDLEGDIPDKHPPVKAASVNKDNVDIGSLLRLPKGISSYFMAEEESFSTPKVKNGRTRITNIETPATTSPEISSNIFHSLPDWSANSPLAILTLKDFIVHDISENILDVNTLENAQKRSRQVECSRSDESETSDPIQVASKSRMGENDVVARCNLDLETETKSFPTANGISKRRVRSLSYVTAKKNTTVGGSEFLDLDDLVGSFSTSDTGNIDEVNEEKNTTADTKDTDDSILGDCDSRKTEATNNEEAHPNMLLKSEREARMNLRETKCRKVQAYRRRRVQRKKGQNHSTCVVGNPELGSKDKEKSQRKKITGSPSIEQGCESPLVIERNHMSATQNEVAVQNCPHKDCDSISLPAAYRVNVNGTWDRKVTTTPVNEPCISTGKMYPKADAVALRKSSPITDRTITTATERKENQTTERSKSTMQAYSATVKNPWSSSNEQRRVYQEKQTYNGAEGGLTQSPMTSWKENIAPQNKLDTEGRKKNKMTERTKSTTRFKIQNVTTSVSPSTAGKPLQKPIASPPQNELDIEGIKKNQMTERSNSTMRFQVQNVTASVSPRNGDRSTQKPVASPPQPQKEKLSAAPTKKLAVGIAARISAMNLS